MQKHSQSEPVRSQCVEYGVGKAVRGAPVEVKQPLAASAAHGVHACAACIVVEDNSQGQPVAGADIMLFVDEYDAESAARAR